MTDEVDELQKSRDQLEVAEACAVLEEARDKMHADRSEKNIAAYKEESNKVSALRVAFREKYPPPTPEYPDGVATPDTVEVAGGVHQG